MGIDRDWNDYLEPEVDGPETYCVYSCPKCGYREVMPEANYYSGACSANITCPKCKSKMHEDTER